MLLMPESQMAQMGLQSFEDTKKKTTVETDPKINAYVQCVLKPVLAAAGPVEGVDKWDIVVFREKEANAFALPGGHIGVYTGILKVAKTPAQLAAVVGHEVGHVIAKHGNERVSEAFGANLVLTAAGILAQRKSQNYGLLVAALGGPAMQFGVLLPHSRDQESEADLIGLDLMAKAGYDPHESIDLWKNMEASGGKQPPEFLSTHPSHGTRIKNLEKNIPSAMTYYNKRKAKGNLPICNQ
jgi:predicted Zn-dependent protease